LSNNIPQEKIQELGGYQLGDGKHWLLWLLKLSNGELVLAELPIPNY
jgi:hypothetical protein